MDFNLFVARMSVVVDFSKLQTAFESVEGFLLAGEGYALTLLAMEGPGEGAIVEIGSFMGRSTCWLGEGTKRAGREGLCCGPFCRFARASGWGEV